MRRNLPLLAALAALAFALAAPAAQAVVAAAADPRHLGDDGLGLLGQPARRNQPAGTATSYRFEYTTEADFLANEFDNALTGSRPAPKPRSAPAETRRSPSSSILGGLEPDTAYRFRARRHQQRRRSGLGPDPLAAPPTNRHRSSRCPTTAAGSWSRRPKKTAARSRAPTASSAAASSRRRPRAAPSPTARPPPSAPRPASPGASQYVSHRGESGWTTENVTLPMLSGSYPESPTSGVPYQLFSDDLGAGLVSNGRRCRSSAPTCPVANPPLPGSGAPAGYRNYYLRDKAPTAPSRRCSRAPTWRASNSGPTIRSRLRRRDARPRPGRPLDLRGAHRRTRSKSRDRRRMRPGRNKPLRVVRRRAEADQLLRATRAAAALAAQSRAISADGSRVYWTDGQPLPAGRGATKQVDQSLGGGGRSRPPAPTARSPSSARAVTSTGTSPRPAATDLTPGGGLEGVLGTSATAPASTT